jgi:hypothetical protein
VSAVVTNTFGNPVPVTQAPTTPFSHIYSCTNTSGGFSGAQQCATSFLVPSRQRLIIQTVSALASFSSSTTASWQDVQMYLGSTSTSVPVIDLPFTAAGSNRWGVTQPLTAYVEPNTTVQVFVDATSDAAGNAAITVEGYLVPAT